MVVGAARLAALIFAAWADGAGRCWRAVPAARGRAGALPARRQDAPAGLAGRAPRRRVRRDQPRRCAAACTLRPRCSAPTSAADVDLHSVPPVTGLLTSATAARSSPRSTCAGTGSTATSCTSARPHRRTGPGRRPQHALPRAPRRRGAEVAPGSAVFGEVPAGEYWSGAPAEHLGAARGPWEERPAGNRRWWPRVYAVSAAALAGIPVVAGASAWPSSSPACAAEAIAGRARSAGAWAGCPSPPPRLRHARSCSSLAAPGWSGSGLAPGHYPVRSRRGLAGLGDAPPARRGAHVAVPALLQQPDPRLAAALGARIGRDVEASTVLLIPTLTHGQRRGVPRRRHPARRLRAGRRLAARRAGEDRQARVRRQLRHGRARPQGAQARAGRGAVRGAAPRAGQGGHLVAGQPADPAAARRPTPPT